MLAFKPEDGTLEISRVGPDDSARQQARQLLGRPVADPVTALAPGLQCSPSEVTTLLLARGDHQLAAALDTLGSAGPIGP